MREPAPLVVCGAPGSAAAPLAAALAEAGLFLGDRCLSGAGGYEDADVAAFQRSVLARVPVPSDADWEVEARALLARKFGGRAVFGWKDARTAFLLERWHAVVPAARWIFVYRDPAVAAWSLLRRDVFDQDSTIALGRALVALRTWRAANQCIVDFLRRHPERCRVLRAPDDYDGAGEVALRAALAAWELPLGPPDLIAAFRPYLVKRRAPGWIRALARALPGVAATWRALEERRSVGPAAPRAAATGTPSAGPTICVFAADVKREYSQTFVHEHLRQLPARTVLLHQEGRTLLTQDDLPLQSPLERLAAAVLREFGHGTDALRDRALARFLRRERADAMLIEFANHAASVVPGCRAAGVPMIVHFHGFDAYRDDLLRQKEDDYRTLFDAAGAVVAVSRAMEAQLERIGAPSGKIRYCPCGVDGTRFAGADPGAAPPTFVAVGRFVDKKGPHLTLLAFRQVVAAHADARLVMIGDGPLLATCRTLAQQIGLDGSVEFRGAQTQSAVLAALRGARAFVQHSLVTGGDSEGTPVAVLEASACGLPVVATHHAGIPDVVRHGESGYLVDEGDVAAMATHMLALARDPDLAASLGRAGRARIGADFAAEHAIARLWQVIDELIGARVPAASS